MTLVSIIGEFDTTILNIINEFRDKIERIILVFDDTIGNAKNLEKYYKVLEKFKKKYSLSYIIENAQIIDEDSSSKIDSMFQIVKTYKDVVIDISNSLGTTSAYIGTKISSYDLKLIAFNPYDNEYNLINKDGFENHKITRQLSVVDYIESLGYRVKLSEHIPKNKEDIFALFANFKDFQKARLDLSNNQQIGLNQYGSIPSILQRLNIIDSDGLLIDRNYLLGGTFEDYMYWIISELGFDDFIAGATIEFDGNSIDGTLVKNEFDILAFKNNRLYLFEFKFKKGIIGLELEKLIFKYMALKEHIKNDSKGIIVKLNSKLGLHNTTVKEDIRLLKKAKMFDIEVVSDFVDPKILKNELTKIIYPSGSKKFSKQQIEHEVKERVYFLGGNDLEMMEIRKLLQRVNAKIVDKNLSWGAKISDYLEEINQLKAGEVAVFVELEQDIKPTIEYEIIDHHGEYSHFPTALEQIASKFNIALDRFQTLVCINDKYHINGLKKAGISSQEIETIRQMDRMAQGVTEEDELLGVEAIKTCKTINKIPIYFSKTNNFSVITDRVNHQNYVIYSESAVCVYTVKSKRTLEIFKEFIKAKQAYYGGLNKMYFCLKEGVLNSHELKLFAHDAANRLSQKGK